MKREIIHIDEEMCNGCGLCIAGCHEGALVLIGGKARLISESYCDGLGACLPACPTGAITIISREAGEFIAPAPGSPADLEEKARLAALAPQAPGCGCPGSQARVMSRQEAVPASESLAAEPHSELNQWPVQIKLVSPQAPYLRDARLLIAADCTAYARANFHSEFIRGRITLIGCPKLDDGDYSVKLAEILRRNNIRSIMVVRMEVPCCGGIEQSVRQALMMSGKMIPWQVVTIGTDGSILNDRGK